MAARWSVARTPTGWQCLLYGEDGSVLLALPATPDIDTSINQTDALRRAPLLIMPNPRKCHNEADHDCSTFWPDVEQR